MDRFIRMGEGGIIDATRILAVASARSAPIKRLLASVGAEHIMNLTYGYPRETVILLEGGVFLIVSVSLDRLTEILVNERGYSDDSSAQ